MNKTELIASIVESADIDKATAEKTLNALMDTISATLSKGESISLIGFGTFSVKERAARTGRNPSTGKPIEIPAKKVVKFKPGKKLADNLND